MPSGSWTPHILTSEDDIPASLKMSRHETKLSDSEDHGPPTSLEKRKSACGLPRLDFEYIGAIKHLLGQDGFEPIKDTVQDQLQCLHAHRQMDVHQTHLTQKNGKTQWEGDPTVVSEKADVRVGVKHAVSFGTPLQHSLLHWAMCHSCHVSLVPLCHLSLLSCITLSHCVMHHLSHFVMPQSLSPVTCPAVYVSCGSLTRGTWSCFMQFYCLQASEVSLGSWQEVKKEDAEAVKWVPDHAAVTCMRCHAPFNLLRRKHHCRCELL